MHHKFHGTWGLVTIRPLEREDFEFVRVLRNRHKDSFCYSEEISPLAQQQWYDRYLKTPGDYMFAVCYQERRVGAVALYQVDPQAGTAEFGRLMIDREAAGIGGLGVVVTRGVCRLAFEQWGIHRVTLEVYADNIPAQITYLKAGFIPIELIFDKVGQKMVRMEYRVSKC